jgi:anti-sigma B factor antagonist
METRVNAVDGIVTVELIGELDAMAAPDARDVVLESLQHGASGLVVECSELTFIDSAGLSVLIEAHREIEARHGTLTIRRPTPLVARLMLATGLDRLVTVEPPLAI